MRALILITMLAVLAGCASTPKNAEGGDAPPAKKEKVNEVRKAGMGQAGEFFQ